MCVNGAAFFQLKTIVFSISPQQVAVKSLLVLVKKECAEDNKIKGKKKQNKKVKQAVNCAELLNYRQLIVPLVVMVMVAELQFVTIERRERSCP